METNLTESLRFKYKEWRTYSRITEEQKEELFNIVFRKGRKIKEVIYISYKQAARQLGIKYGSAKTLIFLYRQSRYLSHYNKLHSGGEKLRQATYRCISDPANCEEKFTTTVTVAGDTTNTYDYFQRLYKLKIEQ